MALTGCTARTEAATTPATPPSAPAAIDPSARGPFTVGYAEIGVIDPFRVRLLPLSIWYPAAPSDRAAARYDILPALSIPAVGVVDHPMVAEGRHPIVVFSHGSGASRLTYWYLTEALASHGFIVIAPDHVGNTFADVADAPGFVRTAAERPRDVHFLVDQLVEAEQGGPNATGPELGDLLRGHLDTDRIGIAGHSYGGYTALASAGGTAFGDEPDPRIKAVAALEPLSDQLTDDNLRAVRAPTLLMGGTLDETTPIDPMVTRPFALVSSPELVRVDVDGASHESFTILCATDHLLADGSVPEDVRRDARRAFRGTCGPEVVPPAEGEALIDRYVVAFFRVELVGDHAYAAALTPTEGVSFQRR